MILIICSLGTDARLPKMDVAGLPFEHHLSTQLRVLHNANVYVVDRANRFGDYLTSMTAAAEAGSDVLITDADVWISMAAVTELRTRMAARHRAIRVICREGLVTAALGESDVLALYLPASQAASYFQKCTSASLEQGLARLSDGVTDCEDIDSCELDSVQPPARVKNMADLAVLENDILHARAWDALRDGVRIRDPDRVAIRGELRCGAGVEIDLNVIIEGRVSLGDEVKIGANAILINATIGAQSVVHPYSLVADAVIGAHSFVGPYARVRPGSTIGDSVQIGNFVEVKNAVIGMGSRINHLAFIGDATLGDGVTIGAGTITCNHDGVEVQRTQIGANAYVGSGCELVAPIRIGENSIIGAGSTITHDAPAGQLTIARSRQVTTQART